LIQYNDLDLSCPLVVVVSRQAIPAGNWRVIFAVIVSSRVPVEVEYSAVVFVFVGLISFVQNIQLIHHLSEQTAGGLFPFLPTYEYTLLVD
jgi:hypothetical protein